MASLVPGFPVSLVLAVTAWFLSDHHGAPAMLTAANSLGLVPAAVAGLLGDLSRRALLIAIAAVGMKTTPRPILDGGGQAVALIVAETAFLAVLILIACTGSPEALGTPADDRLRQGDGGRAMAVPSGLAATMARAGAAGQAPYWVFCCRGSSFGLT